MFIFISSTIILIASIFLISFNYIFMKKTASDLETKIKRYVFGGIEVMGIGAVLVALTMIGSRELDILNDGTLIIIAVLFALVTYITLLVLWREMFKTINSQISKKTINDFKYKFKSISIYGLVYSFGILFYIMYTVSFFK